jgi:pimeloyl-ACP methyl ester carboxylesterase
LAELKQVKKCRTAPRLNVIFIHGLGGDPVGTWQSETSPRQFWPSWLHADYGDVSVWTVGYDAPKTRWSPSKTAMAIQDRATNILEQILAHVQLRSAEIALVGHSMGGLIIKQMLRTADSLALNRPDAAEFRDRVRRVAFIATPHAGSGQASLMNTLRIFARPSAASQGLVRNSPSLRDLNLWYREWAATKNISHLVLTETKATRIVGMIVKPDSSDPGLPTRPIPIDADHSSICKPTTKNSDVYVQVKKLLA